MSVGAHIAAQLSTLHLLASFRLVLCSTHPSDLLPPLHWDSVRTPEHIAATDAHTRRHQLELLSCFRCHLSLPCATCCLLIIWLLALRRRRCSTE